jgi:hypothetical protein
MTVKYYSSAERPALELWLLDDDGSLINFATPTYTFVFKVGIPGDTALLTKSSGITGAAGAGSEPDGTPNVTITWSAGELDIAAGSYQGQLTATTSSLDRVFSFPFEIRPVVT